MIRTEQNLIDDAARRMSFERLEITGEIPGGHAKPEMPISREDRQAKLEKMMAKQAGTNLVL